MMQADSWSKADKQIIRAAFDAAYLRECRAIAEQVKLRIMSMGDDPKAIWDLHDFLGKERNEIREKYDFRYSVLLPILGRLSREGWLTDADIKDLSAKKRDAIRIWADFGK